MNMTKAIHKNMRLWRAHEGSALVKIPDETPFIVSRETFFICLS